jgi:hypothetical protein
MHPCVWLILVVGFRTAFSQSIFFSIYGIRTIITCPIPNVTNRTSRTSAHRSLIFSFMANTFKSEKRNNWNYVNNFHFKKELYAKSNWISDQCYECKWIMESIYQYYAEKWIKHYQPVSKKYVACLTRNRNRRSCMFCTWSGTFAENLLKFPHCVCVCVR